MTMRIRQLGLIDYQAAWDAMRAFNEARDDSSADEIWFAEHPPVYTLGLAGRLEHLHEAGTIPVLRSDRGGQITYHGPGQLLVYLLFDLHRAGMGIKHLVTLLEQAAIDLLAGYGISGARRVGAPGVYVEGAKIAALGLRVRRGRSYHGMALNVAMDLAPFARIDPCGYPGLRVTQLRDLGVAVDLPAVAERLQQALPALLWPNDGATTASPPRRAHTQRA
ncbi:MAG: lipoyl(octanoyl) transferase LipB [Gammaproteobacteria bacterium]|nr:lipoyl(octanoyl) transferase LipB [Gammaproteobacteria bacterium]